MSLIMTILDPYLVIFGVFQNSRINFSFRFHDRASMYSDEKLHVIYKTALPQIINHAGELRRNAIKISIQLFH